MDPRVEKLTSVKECNIFAKNCLERGHPELAKQAQIRGIQIQALEYGAKTEAETAALEAIYAYETLLSEKNGKPTKASRTWQMIKRRGILGAVERVVARKDATQGYELLSQMGLARFAFENVVVKHSQLFSTEAINMSKERLECTEEK